MKCFICQGKLRVSITGGEFYVRDGSEPDNINFEKVTKLISIGEQIDEDIMLTIDVECATDSSHSIFGSTEAAIKYSIYTRIKDASQKLANKYFGEFK
jgi:hypothetical protein